MIIILGGRGYIGTAFRSFFEMHSVEYRTISRSEIDYTRAEELLSFLTATKPQFLINYAGYTGKPNVDACELHKSECLAGNAVLPGVIRQACEQAEVPWGHVSSGCIYSGSRPDGTGFVENDPPNFCFRSNNCSFYSGAKALGEECLTGADNVYIWRLRIPFNHVDSPRNYLSKLLHYDRLLDVRNSISQVDEFVQACWQTWERHCPFGTYNVVNGGSVTTRDVVELIKQHLPVRKRFDFFDSEEDFMREAANTPRSSCVLNNSKLLAAGVAMSSVHDAIVSSLCNWTGAGNQK